MHGTSRAALTASRAAPFRLDRATDARPVVVIGGGVAGATTAYRLRKRGVPVLVLERTPRFGGRIQSETHHAATFETGMQFYYSAYKHTLGLLDEVGLRDQLRPAPVRGFMAYGGKVQPFDKSQPYMKLCSLRENVGLWKTMAPLVPYAAMANPFDFTATDRHADTAVDAYFKPRVSEAVYELAVRTMVVSYSFAEPEGHSLAVMLRVLRLGAVASTMALKKGNDALVRALMQGVRHEHAEAQRVLVQDGAVSGVVVMRAGREEVIETEHVVVAAPPPQARHLFADRADLAARFEALPYSSVLFVNLFLDRALPGDGWVYVHSRKDGHAPAFAIDTLKRCPELFPNGKSVIQVTFAQPHAAALSTLDDETLTRTALESMKPFIKDIAAITERAVVVRRPVAVAELAVGSFAKIRALEARAHAITGLRLVGDYLRAPLCEGAVRSTANVFT